MAIETIINEIIFFFSLSFFLKKKKFHQEFKMRGPFVMNVLSKDNGENV